MKLKSNILLTTLLFIAILSCDKIGPDHPDGDTTDNPPMGILDIAFTYRIQGVPPSQMRRVDLCLAETADYLYKGIYFTCCNVSEAVTHYQFYLPPGTYFYYATVICYAGGDSCKYAGFAGQNALQVAGGKVEVLDGQTTQYTTQFH